MNNTQRWLVIATLVVIGLVLAFIFLEWGWVGRSEYFGIIYRRYGVAGILLGVIAPLCLFATAAFVALGARK